MEYNEKYKNLFSPIKINSLMLPNRIIAAPANGGYSKERATAGAAINIWGCGTVDLANACMIDKIPYMFSKYSYQKTRRILDFMRQGGSKASLEIMHAGAMRRGENNVGPNDEINLEGLPVRALKEEELIEIAKSFGKIAKDAKDFGFDMVMAHFAHGWLPAEFLSPAWNKRTDEYGGSYENRARFPLMILKEIRKAVGKDYPVDMRISAKEWVENEIDFEDVVRFIKDAQEYIDMVNISAGTDMDKQGCVHMATTALEPRLTNIEFSKRIKQEVNIPVAVVGSIMLPEDAERIIKEGYADLVMIGRALIADPFWIKKIKENREEDIVPCIRCTYCSHWTTGRYNHGCSVNPRYLSEDWLSYDIEKINKPKKFVVVGAGVAGMKAALVASEKGHKVTLIDKQEQMGGILSFVNKTDHKYDLGLYLKYLINQVNKSNIDVRLNTIADKALIESLKPDVLIIAVGSKPNTLPIEGFEKAIVATDIYNNMDDVGKNVVILGGGTIGCELALELDEKGHNVVIVEALDKLHRQDNQALDIALDQHLAKAKNIKVYLNTKCKKISDNRVILDNNNEVEYDTLISAVGLHADKQMVDSLYGIIADTYTIGDCVRPAKIKEATEMAYLVAMNV